MSEAVYAYQVSLTRAACKKTKKGSTRLPLTRLIEVLLRADVVD